MRNLRYSVASSLILAATTVQSVAQDAGRYSVEGVWRVAEITTVSPSETKSNSQPQPGLFIFTKGYYSAVWTPGDLPRPEYADTWRPTDQEKVAAYDSIIVNTGTYKVFDSELITSPVLARVPGFAGGTARYKYRVDGDTLFLEKVEEHSGKGARLTWYDENRLPLKLVRVE